LFSLKIRGKITQAILQYSGEGETMTSLKTLGISATGGLAVLIAALLVSSQLKLGWEPLFAVLLVVFVIAGAISLLARSGALSIS